MANMIKYNLGYSLKNIPIPPQNTYLKKLIEQTENFLKRLRWRVFYYTSNNGSNETPTEVNNRETYGFKSQKTPAQNSLLLNFESDIYNMISSVKFRHAQNEFQNQMKQDIKMLKSGGNIIVEADKTSNLYLVPPQKYEQLLHQNITKDYKIANPEIKNNINRKANILAKKLKIDDYMERYTENSSFISLKDHKENFYSNPKCRLINPAKTSLGRVSKKILERIISEVKEKTTFNQWKSTAEVKKWFENFKDHKKSRFIKFDIQEFYPSITPELLDRAISFAQSLTTITPEEIEIIKSSKESLLFNKGKCWVKKSEINFDVTMGSLDGAYTSGIVGLYLLNKIKDIVPKGKSN